MEEWNENKTKTSQFGFEAWLCDLGVPWRNLVEATFKLFKDDDI